LVGGQQGAVVKTAAATNNSNRRDVGRRRKNNFPYLLGRDSQKDKGIILPWCWWQRAAGDQHPRKIDKEVKRQRSVTTVE